MKRFALLAVLLHGALFSLPNDSVMFLFAQETRLPKTDAEHIALLGDDSYRIRELATQTLLRRGPACGVAVARSTFDPCFEGQQRASYILGTHREHYSFPSDETIAAGIAISVSNPRFWSGMNPLLQRPDESLDCALTISSPHIVTAVQSPVGVSSGKGDDGSLIGGQVWKREMQSACGTSVGAQCYLSRPGTTASTVQVSAILRLHLAPIEVVTFDDLAPKGGSIVFHQGCTWAEDFQTKSAPDEGREISFRMFDLAGRLDNRVHATLVDTEGIASTPTLTITGPTQFGADVRIAYVGSSKPKEIKLILPPGTVREIRAPVEFEVPVPPKH